MIPRVTRYDIVTDDGSPTGVTVEFRDVGSWAVLRGRQCLSTSGEWDWEPLPSARTDEWKKAHRFDHDMAILRARRVAAS